MTEKINGFMAAVFGERASGIVFIVALSAVFASFITEIVSAIVLPRYGVKKRVRFFSFSIAAVAAQLISCAYTKNYVYALAVTGFASVLSAAVLTVPEKKTEITERERSLVKFIDGKIKDAYNNDGGRSSPKTRLSETAIKVGFSNDGEIDCLKKYGDMPNGKIKPPDPDFSHIRSVMSRLEYYALSSADKKTVAELGGYINEAERGDADESVKEKINDGLGALLKIMSKYGV